jgi:zinc protease
VPQRHAGINLGGVATQNARIGESIAVIRAQWQHMHDAGPTAEELANAKTYLNGAFPLQLDSTRRIAGVLVELQQEKLGIDYLDRRAGLINGVTLDDAKRVARRFFDPKALGFAVVGSPTDLKPTREVSATGG